MKAIRRAFLIGIVVALGSGSVASAADASDPALGTWTLNLPKSEFNPGPAPKSQTRTYIQSAEGVTWTAKGVAADGSPTFAQSTTKLDGKDYPVTGRPWMDTLSTTRINARTIGFTGKKVGKVVETGTREVSADGKVLTVLVKGTDAKGVPFNNVQVFDKQ